MKNNETENQYLLLFRDDGWYTHLSAEELEATAIAKGMPSLDYGTQVEVRPIATECPLTAQLQTMASELVAA
jgi:hypothetical protein